MKAATLIKTDGTQESVLPTVKKSKFVLAEMRKFVGGSIGLIHLLHGEVLVVNDNGKHQQLPLNQEASNLLIAAFGESQAATMTGTYPPSIVGNVLHCLYSQVD
jgi:hypothetical protein